MLLYRTFWVTLFWECLIAASCLVGDKVVSLLQGRANNVARAATDSLTHGMVAFFSWALVTQTESFTDVNILMCLMCLLLAMIVDIDHFVMAKSFSLQDALSLRNRPPFHATTIVLVTFTLLWCCSFAISPRRFRLLALMSVAAWLSHHIRDGTRRGLWIPPFGTTPPFQYEVYIVLTLTLPIVLRTCYVYFIPENVSVESSSNII